MAKKNRKKTNSFSNPKDAPCPFPFDSYELQREGTLITQAGLITAVFSFSTTALFAVWQVGLAELERIPDMWIHLCMGFITFLLLLSMFAAVTCLHIFYGIGNICLYLLLLSSTLGSTNMVVWCFIIQILVFQSKKTHCKIW